MHMRSMGCRRTQNNHAPFSNRSTCLGPQEFDEPIVTLTQCCQLKVHCVAIFRSKK